MTRRKDPEALVRVEDEGLDPVDHLAAPAEPLHGAEQNAPVEKLVLPRRLVLFEAPLTPDREVSAGERLEEQAVRISVGPEVASARCEEGVRPARGSDESDAPRALGERVGEPRADLHAAARSGRRGIRGARRRGRPEEMRETAARREQAGTVAVHVKRHDRVWKAGAVPVEIE